MHKIHYKNIEKLFGFTRQTWAKWGQENRPIVKLIGYFEDEDINQLLTTDRIAKLENLNLVHEAAQTIVKKFFYTIYTNERKNNEFLNIIFPLYVESENQRVANHKKIFHDKMVATQNDERKKEISHKIDTIYAKYNKRDLIRFIVETEMTIDKTSALFEISHLSDLEIHLLVSEYKNFVSRE